MIRNQLFDLPSWLHTCFPRNPVAPKTATRTPALVARPPGPSSFNLRSVIRGRKGSVDRALRPWTWTDRCKVLNIVGVNNFEDNSLCYCCNGCRRVAPSRVACRVGFRLPSALLYLEATYLSMVGCCLVIYSMR